MELLDALQWTQALLFALLAVAALRSWWQHRTAPAAYVAAAFGGVGFATVSNRLSDTLGPNPPELYTDATTVLIVLFPWFLAAFAWSFEGRLPTWLRAAGVVTLAAALVAFALPALPDDGARSSTQQAWVGVVLALWTVLSLAAAAHLWRAGRGQPVVRARTRLLALGAVVLTVTLLLAGTADAPDDRGFATVTSLLVIASALLFAAGFAPPAPLRLYWRQLPNQRMYEMQTALVAAVTPDEAADAVVPVVADTLGGGALCLAADGRVTARAGLTDREADATVAALRGQPRAELPGLQVREVDGWVLAVQTSPYAPILGEDERNLLDRFALQFRLAVQRAELYTQLEHARDQLAAAGDELQSMLVGLAHDLRSPAVTISTYAALLPDAEDVADQRQMLDGLQDGSAYLDRLVDGLLSLSRIGRNDGEPEPVALESVVAGVARRLAATHPDVSITTDGRLPTLHVDRLRIEQVFDNLAGNAAKHGGRDDLTIAFSWSPGAEGGTIVVADDGRGVAEHERESVFGLFRRGSTTAAGSGVGLGLVRRIVEHLGGTIRLAPSDVGARVEIRVPASIIDPDGSDAATRQSLPSRERSSRNV